MRTRIKPTNKNWKEKAVSRGQSVRRLKQEIKRQKARNDKWREKYYGLKSDSRLVKVKNYKYPLELIWMSVLMHINFNVSLRGARQSMVKLGELYGLNATCLSHMTIRNWCLKLGLYCLSRRPLPRGRCVLISDESVEMGRERLLLIYMVPIERCSPIRPLCMEDVRVLEIGVQAGWSAEQVAEKIEAKTKSHGLEIAYGISDNCTKLKRAMDYCNIKWIGDCTHEIANVSKALFKRDEQSNRFIKKMNLLRGKWILSRHVLLVPPELRTKGRFNQMFIIHKWAEQILKDWENICDQAREELLFVKDNGPLIRSMRQCYDLIELFCSIFKCKGIHRNTLKQWDADVQAYRGKEILCEKAEQFIEKMNAYLARQKVTIPQEMQILCCSDIIESTFGKYKNKGVKIITDDVLKIAGYSNQSTLEQVQRAMQEIKTADVAKWKQENTTISKLALLKRRRKSAA